MPTLFTRQIPDPERVDRARRNPQQGPRILFFSGGTALRETSQALIGYTHNSVHLVTPFDSGGSSAVLRAYFGMPAVGDLRSRLMALADRSAPGYPHIFNLFAHRLPKTATPKELRQELKLLVQDRHPLLAPVPDPMRKIICRHLQLFAAAIGIGFDLRGASIGNLILAAGYLENRRNLDSIIDVYSRLVQVRGEVRLVLGANLHLRAVLDNGAAVVGQHLLTGKEVPPLTHPIAELGLVDPAKGNAPARPLIRDTIRQTIQEAELICYPVGSLYTSLLANLLPAGVGGAVSRAACPKVFIPNTLPDPESIGLSLAGQVQALVRYLRADGPSSISAESVLQYVLLDPDVTYPGTAHPERDLEGLGVRVIRTPLVNPVTGAVDPHLLCQALVSLV